MNGLDAVKIAMEMETPGQKVKLVVGTVFHFLVAGIIASIFLVWMINVRNIQNEYDSLCSNGALAECPDADIILYDVLFEFGPYTDRAEAINLRQ